MIAIEAQTASLNSGGMHYESNDEESLVRGDLVRAWSFELRGDASHEFFSALIDDEGKALKPRNWLRGARGAGAGSSAEHSGNILHIVRRIISAVLVLRRSGRRE
jgi:hypothetical protein